LRKARSLSDLLSIITVLLVAAVMVAGALAAADAYEHEQQAARVLAAATVAQHALTAKVDLRNELGLLDSAFDSPMPIDAPTARDIAARQAQTFADFGLVMDGLDRAGVGHLEMRSLLGREVKLFHRTMESLQLPGPQRRKNLYRAWDNLMGLLTQQVDTQSGKLSRDVAGVDPFVDDMIRINDAIWRMRNDTGKDRGVAQWSIGRNRMPEPIVMRGNDQTTGQINARWADVLEDIRLHAAPPPLIAAVQNAQKAYFTNYRAARKHLYDQLAHGVAPSMTPRQWFRFSNLGLESIARIGQTALALTAEHAASEVAAAKRRFYGAIGMMLTSMALAMLAAAFVMRLVILPLRRITQSMRVIAGGNLEEKIPFRDRADEIGQFAQSLAMFRDAALERERLKAELLENQSAKETAEMSNRLKSEFLANMSHELRTPLNAIIGFSEIISTEALGPDAPRYREYAGDILGAGTHLLSLINDILDLSKVEAGKLDLHYEKVDLTHLIKECVQLMHERALQQGLRLSQSVDALPPMLIDRLRVKQIMLNLLSNAIKFTPEGGTVAVEAAQGASGLVTVCVRDTGIGIAPDMIPLVFQPFRQVDSALARKFEGTGLGLSLVKTLIELHGGAVRIESALEKGTSAVISFPASCLAGESGDVRKDRLRIVS
jgi:signal transduction histidine kinase